MNLIKKLEEKHPKFCEVIRFLIIGGTATLIDMFVMALVIYFSSKSSFNSFFDVFINKHSTSGFIVALASALGFVVGLIFNYIFSFKFVYKGNNDFAKTKKGFFFFTGLSLIGLLIQTIGVYIGYSVFNINEWIVKIIFVIIVLIFNYITRKIFIFKN